MAEQKTSNENLMGAAAYLLGPVTGIVLLLVEKKNEYIRLFLDKIGCFIKRFSA